MKKKKLKCGELEKKAIKKNSGITLIALVITIIVLLILAGVTIATLTGENGILTRASDASKETEIASVKEQARLDISNWVAGELENGREATISDWEDIKNILDTENPNIENRYYADVTEEGVETPKGYFVPIEELYTIGSNEEETTSKTIEDLEAGDKVYYDTGNTNVGIIECYVLYDSNSEYGVQIISADTVDTVTLGGNDLNTSMNSYNNGITTLNAKAEAYLNTTYASDARCVGSVPNNKNAESGNYTSEYEYISSFKDADTNYETDYKQMGTLEIRTTNSLYWLASRSVSYSSSLSCYYFNMRCISTSGSLAGNGLCSVYLTGGGNGGGSISCGFRPVFTLNSEIKVTEGDGDITPYTLAP